MEAMFVVDFDKVRCGEDKDAIIASWRSMPAVSVELKLIQISRVMYGA